MPIKGVKPCGAKCRTKNGASCGQPGMKNGRCKMHGGVFYKRETHGDTTLRAIRERKQERALLKEMKAVNKEINEIEIKKRSLNTSSATEQEENYHFITGSCQIK